MCHLYLGNIVILWQRYLPYTVSLLYCLTICSAYNGDRWVSVSVIWIWLDFYYSPKLYCSQNAFSALPLLVGWQEGHPACKNWVVRYWRGHYLSGARCKWFAYDPADGTATPSSLAPVKSRMAYLSGAGLPRLSWKKRPLNGCSSSSSSMLQPDSFLKFKVCHMYRNDGIVAQRVGCQTCGQEITGLTLSWSMAT